MSNGETVELCVTPADEKRVVHDILQSLAKYMIDSKINVKYLSEMKLQKIVFKTVEELDLPVTRSWYIRGCMVHPGGTLTGSVKKKTIEKLVINPESLVVNSDIYSCFDNIQVKKIFFTRKDIFLRELYSSMEPERFRKEYVPNNELILSLEKMSQGGFDGVNAVISENISKLYLGIQGDELFNSISNNFYDFLDFMENVSIEVEGSIEDGAEITPADLEFFKQLNYVYYSNVWVEPATVISIETAQGPSAERVREQRQGYLPLAARKIEEPLNELKRKTDELNLSLSSDNIEKAFVRSCERIGVDAGKNLIDIWKMYAK